MRGGSLCHCLEPQSTFCLCASRSAHNGMTLGPLEGVVWYFWPGTAHAALSTPFPEFTQRADVSSQITRLRSSLSGRLSRSRSRATWFTYWVNPRQLCHSPAQWRCSQYLCGSLISLVWLTPCLSKAHCRRLRLDSRPWSLPNEGTVLHSPALRLSNDPGRTLPSPSSSFDQLDLRHCLVSSLSLSVCQVISAVSLFRCMRLARYVSVQNQPAQHHPCCPPALQLSPGPCVGILHGLLEEGSLFASAPRWQFIHAVACCTVTCPLLRTSVSMDFEEEAHMCCPALHLAQARRPPLRRRAMQCQPALSGLNAALLGLGAAESPIVSVQLSADSVLALLRCADACLQPISKSRPSQACVLRCRHDQPALARATHPMRGVRIGEASHPGPSTPRPQPTLLSYWGAQPAPTSSRPPSDRLTVVVANPTAVLGKVHELLELRAHVLLLAETSAVSSTQSTLTAQLRPHNFRCHWSAPVLPHNTSPGKVESRRGVAGGAAVLASLPSHAAFTSVPEDLWDTQRIAEAIIRVGGLRYSPACCQANCPL